VEARLPQFPAFATMSMAAMIVLAWLYSDAAWPKFNTLRER
jgi:hypothetical protein